MDEQNREVEQGIAASLVHQLPLLAAVVRDAAAQTSKPVCLPHICTCLAIPQHLACIMDFMSYQTLLIPVFQAFLLHTHFFTASKQGSASVLASKQLTTSFQCNNIAPQPEERILLTNSCLLPDSMF